MCSLVTLKGADAGAAALLIECRGPTQEAMQARTRLCAQLALLYKVSSLLLFARRRSALLIECHMPMHEAMHALSAGL